MLPKLWQRVGRGQVSIFMAAWLANIGVSYACRLTANDIDVCGSALEATSDYLKFLGIGVGLYDTIKPVSNFDRNTALTPGKAMEVVDQAVREGSKDGTISDLDRLSIKKLLVVLNQLRSTTPQTKPPRQIESWMPAMRHFIDSTASDPSMNLIFRVYVLMETFKSFLWVETDKKTSLHGRITCLRFASEVQSSIERILLSGKSHWMSKILVE